MIFCSILVIYTEDPANVSQESFTLWQDTLMKCFMKDIPVRHARAFSRDAQFKPGHVWRVCNRMNWPNIGCDESRHVQSIEFRRENCGNFFLNMLPSSTQSIIINNCRQSFRIKTRCWPRSLVNIELENNRIHGHPDLTTLPHNLQEASLFNNRMSGYITLTHLPPKFRKLYLQGNAFQQDTVFYHNLPVGLEKIEFQHWGRPKNKFREICALDETQKLPKSERFKFVGVLWIDGGRPR